MTNTGTSLSFEHQALPVAAAGMKPIRWEEVMELHGNTVLRFAYSQVGDIDEAADIAQETFVQAHRSLTRYNQNLAMRPWLFGISLNVARNHRRAKARQFAAIQRIAMEQRRPATHISDLYEQRWISQLVREALDCMDANDRQVIVLRHFMGLTIHETAQAMKIASGTVKSRTHRAMTRFRSLIEINFPALCEAA